MGKKKHNKKKKQKATTAPSSSASSSSSSSVVVELCEVLGGCLSMGLVRDVLEAEEGDATR